MPPQTRLFRLMQGVLHEYLQPLSEESMRQLPAGGGSSINWIVGHLVLANEFGTALLGHPTKYLDAMSPIYGPGTTPTDDPDVLVPVAELQRRFDETGDAMLRQYADAEAATLQAPQESGLFTDQLPTVDDMMQHLMSTHLAVHVGQISQQRRERGLPPLVG